MQNYKFQWWRPTRRKWGWGRGGGRTKCSTRRRRHRRRSKLFQFFKKNSSTLFSQSIENINFIDTEKLSFLAEMLSDEDIADNTLATPPPPTQQQFTTPIRTVLSTPKASSSPRRASLAHDHTECVANSPCREFTFVFLFLFKKNPRKKNSMFFQTINLSRTNNENC